MSKVILPQVFRIMLLSIINQFIISMKDISLISVIGIRELTQNGKIIAANAAPRVMVIWLVVAAFYLNKRAMTEEIHLQACKRFQREK